MTGITFSRFFAATRLRSVDALFTRPMTLLRERVARRGVGAIEPCLPSSAKAPPAPTLEDLQVEAGNRINEP